MKNILVLIGILTFAVSKSLEIKAENVVPTQNAVAGNLHDLDTVIEEGSGRRIITGNLAVRENRSKTDSRLIILPIKIFCSTSEQPSNPVFYLTGGPGNSNLTFWPPDELLEQRDLVMIGYRGVDGNSRLDCPDFLNFSSKNNLFSKEAISIMQNNILSCLDSWKEAGIEIDCYTMTDVIDDMEIARKALEYDDIHLLSSSYGTRLAQIFAYRYPESLYRSLMVSVNPPGHFVWSPETIDRQINYYSELWSKDSIYSKKTANLSETVKRVMHNMPDKWLFFKIDPDKVRFATFMGLYHTNSAGSVFDAFIAADNGDPSGLALVSLMMDWQLKNRKVAWGDMLAKSYVDYNPAIDYFETMKVNSNIMGSPGSQLFAVHNVWPVNTKDTIYNRVQATDVQTLMLSGNIDLSTPAENAHDELLPYLNHGQQFIFSEMGHSGDIINRNYGAFIKTMTSFYKTGEANISLYKYSSVNFKPEISFPQLAKIAIGLIILAIVLLFGIFFLIRFVIIRFRTRASKRVIPQSRIQRFK